MNNEVRRVSLLLIATMIVAFSACRHKPAYSDIDPNKPISSQNQNSATQPATSSPPPASEPAPTPVTPPPQAQTYKPPSFFDQARGQIKDIPNYPRAARVHVQLGPVGELNMVSIILQTSDEMDKIAAFYNQALKDNQWKINDKIIDPEMCEWNLEKGKDNTGKVQVKRDPQTGRKSIIIVRGEKIAESSK